MQYQNSLAAAICTDIQAPAALTEAPHEQESESGHFISAAGCIVRGRNVGDTGTVLYEWINGVPDQAGNT